MKKEFDFANFISLAPYANDVKWYDPWDDVFGHFGSDQFSNKHLTRFSPKEIRSVKKVSEAVAFLAKNTAGLELRFKTNSKRIMLDVILPSSPNMGHMTGVGQSGFDLYTYDEKEKRYIFHSNTVFSPKKNKYQMQLLWYNDGKMRDYILYFPLYMGVKVVKIGFDYDSIIEPNKYKNTGKIMLYGTSIGQGGCVSRPGMLYTSILSRKLEKEFLNYSFSGSALGESIIAKILAKREDIDLFIIDIQANAGCTSKLEDNLENFIDIYHNERPNVPILLVTQIPFAMDIYDKDRTELKLYYKEFINKVVRKYKRKGLDIWYLDGDKFFNNTELIHFTEYTVDGVHPTDAGAILIANGYYKKIKKVLKDCE